MHSFLAEAVGMLVMRSHRYLQKSAVQIVFLKEQYMEHLW